MHPVFRGPFVKSLWCHVDAVGPDDGADLGVNANLGEEGLVGEWLEHTTPVTLGEVDVADEPVLECEAQLMIADHLDAGHINELVHGRDFSAADRSDALDIR
jgi:hypothetical protein